MGSLQAESEEKQEMDDSGIQDEAPPSKKGDNGVQGVQLLDLSDDVLLLILRFLTPRDLKALGYTCPRLGALILDRTLWQRVDARSQPWTRARLRWYLTRALHRGTSALLVAGYAREPSTCPGNQTREAEGEGEGDGERGDKAREEDNNNSGEHEQSDSLSGQSDRSQSPRVIEVPALGPNAQLFIDDQREESRSAWVCSCVSERACGPRLTLAPPALRQLARTCPALAELALEDCNIDCNMTSINQFPATLKKLSLRGSKCYNLPLDRSFLFKIQDILPNLEVLDVSECEWMEPASLLPLSKLPALRQLCARDCPRLTEFVAYASLATRYGFLKLQCLDLRGSPVGDSEVSALGWLSDLTQLWLSPLRASTARRHARHTRHTRPDRWETQEPDYFKINECTDSPKEQNCASHTWQATVNSKDTNGHSTQNTTSTLNTSTVDTTPSPRATPSPPPSKRSPSNSPRPSKRPSSPCNSPSTPRPSKRSSSPSPTPRPSKRPSSPCNSPSTPRPSKRSSSPSNSPSPTPGPSKRPRPTQQHSSDDDDVPLKCLIDKDTDTDKETVNRGASTSNARIEEPSTNEPPGDREAEPRHHVLYVNVGQQLHAVYRLSLDAENIASLNRHPNRNIRNIILTPPGAHLNASSLVTDSAIRRFGRADGEDVNYVHIGPNGPYAAPSASRPDRSSLTHLTVSGFRNITDRSLEHLATSAPHLRYLDFSETSVTDAGVAAFRSLRPECEVKYSPYVEKE